MHLNRVTTWSTILLLTLTLAACGGRSGTEAESAAPTANAERPAASQDPEALAAEIGPVKEVSLGAQIDAALAQQGQQLFNTYCTACHRLDERFIGPALGDVTQRRGPVYLMNVMLNPNGMIQRHPVMKQLVEEYGTLMTDMGLTEDQARAILEYLRQVAETN
ncbi:cytochrome c [Rhodothermus profundi]|uniref:Cytochrome c n=1 Tax=Rhodothermus profundi TaxID=633813 RepID=A0A1M6PQK1_9BACT|nr:cytochrome c [Rhodothermus profundi]SHK10213.1 Cytochrome c [Rhodothermus profundi]